VLDQAIPLIKALNGCTGLGWSKHRLGQCQRCSLVEASRIGNSEQRWCERIGYDGLLADPSLEIGVERVDPAAACDIGIAAARTDTGIESATARAQARPRRTSRIGAMRGC